MKIQVGYKKPEVAEGSEGYDSFSTHGRVPEGVL